MLSQLTDTESAICAISTPPGTGGIAVVRITGPGSIGIVDKLWHGQQLTSVKSHTAHLGEIIDPSYPDQPLDQCVATVYRAPASFTGQDTVELSVHGSKWIQREIINLLCTQGCRTALPGEFTRRAVMNRRIDLTQAEAIADVIASGSRAAHAIAASQLKGSFSNRLKVLRDHLLRLSTLLELELDFSEEDVEFASRTELKELATTIHSELKRLHSTYKSGAAIKDGIPVAIAGAPNVGKSSLLNLLLSDDRAIVSDIPGTTRDTVEETLEVGDYLLRFIDTAGLRETSDPVEQLGISRSRTAMERAGIILMVIDPTATQTAYIPEISNHDAIIIPIINKTDICPDGTETIPICCPSDSEIKIKPAIGLSAKTGQGLDNLFKVITSAIEEIAPGASEADSVIITNARQAQALEEASQEAARIIESLNEGLPGDLIAIHLRTTISILSTLTGDITTPEILSTIFSSFCIGK